MAVERLNVTSRKSTCVRLHCMSIWNPMSLNIFIMSFRIASACFPLVFRKIKRPSSLYSPLPSLCILLFNLERMNSPTSSQTSECMPDDRVIVKLIVAILQFYFLCQSNYISLYQMY